MKVHDDYHAVSPIDEAALNFFFGITLTVFLFAISLFPLLQGRGIRIWAVCAAVVVLAASYFCPVVLVPFRKVWQRFGLLIQRITQPLILGMVFYVFITPVGVIMRCLGKDPLCLKRKSAAHGYWKLREVKQPNADMKNQF